MEFRRVLLDRKSTCLNSSHLGISHAVFYLRTEEHTSELQSLRHLACRLLLEIKTASVHTPMSSSTRCLNLDLWPNTTYHSLSSHSICSIVYVTSYTAVSS